MVWKDLEFCNVILTEEEIVNTKKSKFKAMIKKKIKPKSDEFLIEIQAKHSKSINLEISDEPQVYLTSEELNLDEKRLLFKLRSRMIDIKNNFKSKYKGNLLCTFCDTCDVWVFTQTPS